MRRPRSAFAMFLLLLPVVAGSCDRPRDPDRQPSLSSTRTAIPEDSGLAGSISVFSVSPGKGSVGTTVIIDGRNCKNASDPTTYLAFEGHGDEGGSVGADDIPRIPTDDSGSFRTSYVIPATFHSFRGEGGGDVKPGRYYFNSHPPACQAVFRVVGSD